MNPKCKPNPIIAFLFACILGTTAVNVARADVINQFLPEPVTTALEWYSTPDTGPSSVAEIVDLTGAGGDLENNNPLGLGAAHLQTGSDNSDRAAGSIFNDFGNAATVLNNIDLAYSYHKVFVSGGNAAAAPALKIDIYNPSGSGTGDNDSFGTLIWEAANQGVGNPATDLWTSVVLDEDSGSGGDSSGGWWWSGGFGYTNSGAGAPFRSLAEWVTAFQTGGDSTDFAGASVTSFSIGIGSFNQNVDSYFDDVSISINDNSVSFLATYDFEPVIVPHVPEPTGLMLVTLACIGGAVLRRPRRRV